MQVEVSVQLGPSLQTLVPTPAAATVAQISPQDWQQWFTQWFELLQPQQSPLHAYALSLTLTDDPTIQELNATYRNCDRPTDVLAFAACDGTSLPEMIWQTTPMELGDIIISVETALRQAPEHHHTPQQELAWLASHGLLHLLGWDHPNAIALQKMLDQQEKLLQQIDLFSVSG